MNWDAISKNVDIITKIHNMHVTLRGQAKGLRRLNRKNQSLRTQVANLITANELAATMVQRLVDRADRLENLNDSLEHDIQTLKLEIAEFDGGTSRWDNPITPDPDRPIAITADPDYPGYLQGEIKPSEVENDA